MEDSGYRAFFILGLRKFQEAVPEFTMGQMLHSIKYQLRRLEGKSLFEATDQEIYKALSVAIEKESEDEQD
jgi:hypothetical protein